MSEFTDEQLRALDRINELATYLAGPEGRPCGFCGGTGEVTYDGVEWECGRCGGEGIVSNG